MYINEYTIRDQEKCLSDVFFKEPNLEVVIDFGEFKQGWNAHQRLTSIGTATNVVVTFYPGGVVSGVGVLKAIDATQLKDIAVAVENAGGRLFYGQNRVYGHPKSRKKKVAPTDI